jgi:hypothetical protein
MSPPADAEQRPALIAFDGSPQAKGAIVEAGRELGAGRRQRRAQVRVLLRVGGEERDDRLGPAADRRHVAGGLAELVGAGAQLGVPEVERAEIVDGTGHPPHLGKAARLGTRVPAGPEV